MTMRSKFAFVMPLLLAGVLTAQPRPMAERGEEHAQQRLEPLREALSLSDDQVKALQENNRAFMQSAREIFREAAEKRRALQAELDSDNPNAAAVGQYMIEAKQAQEKVQAKRAEFRESALAVLDEQQQASLAQLEAAMKAAPAARQAAAMNLLEGEGGGRGAGFGAMRGMHRGDGPMLMLGEPGHRGGPGMMRGRMRVR